MVIPSSPTPQHLPGCSVLRQILEFDEKRIGRNCLRYDRLRMSLVEVVCLGEKAEKTLGRYALFPTDGRQTFTVGKPCTRYEHVRALSKPVERQ